MKRPIIRLRFPAIALILTLTALPAFAGGRTTQPTKAPNLLAWVSQELERFVPALGMSSTSSNPDDGSLDLLGKDIDPNGGNGDPGQDMDPSG